MSRSYGERCSSIGDPILRDLQPVHCSCNLFCNLIFCEAGNHQGDAPCGRGARGGRGRRTRRRPRARCGALHFPSLLLIPLGRGALCASGTHDSVGCTLCGAEWRGCRWRVRRTYLTYCFSSRRPVISAGRAMAIRRAERLSSQARGGCRSHDQIHRRAGRATRRGPLQAGLTSR